MLTMENISFSYGNNEVFNELNLSIDEKEFVVLIGSSGAGKTTLMQMIYMNIFPDNGKVEVAGFNSDDVKEKEIPFLRRTIGYIFQDFRLLQNKTVYENLEFVLRVTNTPNKLISKKIFNVLSLVGLSHKTKNYPNELSGGEKQRIAIARAIINEPRLILADEPTGNLDPETSNEILEIIKKIHNRGTAILFATHNYSLLKNLDAKIITIADKKIKQVKLKE